MVPFALTSTDFTPGKSSTESSIAHTVGDDALPSGTWLTTFDNSEKRKPVLPSI